MNYKNKKETTKSLAQKTKEYENDKERLRKQNIQTVKTSIKNEDRIKKAMFENKNKEEHQKKKKNFNQERVIQRKRKK